MSLITSLRDQDLSWQFWFVVVVMVVFVFLAGSGVFNKKKEGFKGKGVSFTAAIKISVAVISGVAILAVLFGNLTKK